MRDAISTRSGFTLVELLVVIAIIGLLVSLVIPSLGIARGRAQQVVCSGNLRQMHVGMMQFAADHRGYVPLACRLSSQRPWEERGQWWTDIGPYLGYENLSIQPARQPVGTVLSCPADRDNPLSTRRPEHVAPSYGMNGMRNLEYPSYAPLPLQVSIGRTNSEWIVWGDQRGGTILFPNQPWGDPDVARHMLHARHLDEANLLLLGGAVRSVPFGHRFPSRMLLP